jgi:membrane protein
MKRPRSSLGSLAAVVGSALRNFSTDHGSQAAAAIAYYSLVSVMPLLLFLVGVGGLLLQRTDFQNAAVDAALRYIPGQAEQLRPLLESVLAGVAGKQGAALSLVALLGALWTASAVFGQIRLSLNVAFHVSHQRPPVQQKLIDLGMVFVTGLLLVLAIGVTAVLQFVGNLGAVRALPAVVWGAVTFLAPLILVVVAFLLLYWLVPARRLRLGQVGPAAVAAAVLFQAVEFAFTFYLAHFAHYGVIYGSLGALVAILFWVYLEALILILGAELAAESSRRLPLSPAESPSPPQPPFRKRLLRLLRSLVFTDPD